MTIGTQYEGDANLAALMSAREDRKVAGSASKTIDAHPSFDIHRGLDPSDGVNYSGGSSYSPYIPLLPSRVGLAGTMNAGQTDPVLKEIKESKRYLKRQRGKAWPSRFNAGKVGGGVLEPTTMSFVSNMNEGWNAAAQPGSPPGTQEGYQEMSLGPSTWAEAFNYAPSPLTEKLGSLGLLSPSRMSTKEQERVEDLLALQKRTAKKMRVLLRRIERARKATPSQKRKLLRLQEVKARTTAALRKAVPNVR